MKIQLIITLFLTLSLQTQAAEYFEYNESIKSQGMGGVQLLFNKPAEVLHHNPAGLAFAEGFNLQVIGFRLGANGLDLVNSLSGLDTNNSSSLSSITGKPIWINGLGSLTFTMPHFGIGAYKNFTLSTVLNNPAFPNMSTTLYDDSAYIVGFGSTLTQNFSWGMNLKRMTRAGGSKEISIGTIVDAVGSNDMSGITNQFEGSGVGYGIDTSMMFQFSSPIQPMLVVSWKDIGSTSFKNVSTKTTEAPNHIDDNLSVGLGTLIDLPGLDVSTGIEYRNAMQKGPLGKKLHLGTEISLPIFDLRAGLNQGYMTYGLGMNFFVFNIDLSYYTKELGEYPGQTPQNRIQFGFNMDFGFDANFNLNDSSGKKRKLKQRR